MTSVLALGLRLAWGSREQRIRSFAVAAACALGGASLLLVWAVARDRLVGANAFYSEVDYVIAGALLVMALPVVAMVATVARLQTRGREARLANLRRLGLSASRTRLVAAVEVGIASATGVLLAIPLSAALGLLVRQVEVTGQPWNPALFSVPHYGWPWVLVGVPAVAVLVAAWPPSDAALAKGVDPDAGLGAGAAADGVGRPGVWRLGPLLLGLAMCGWAILHSFDEFVSTAEALAVLGGIALAGLGVLLAAPVLVRLLADAGVRVARGPVTTIVARRLQAQPAAVLRIVATLMAVLVVLAGTQGVLGTFRDLPQYVEAKRSLTEGQVAEVPVGAAEAPGTVERLIAIPEVEQVVDLPLVSVSTPRPDRRDETVLAVVATCADLAAVGAAVPDCVEGRVLVGDERADLVTAESGSLRPLGREARRSPEEPSILLDLADAVQVPAGDLYDWRVAGGVNLVVPPETPGIGALVDVTDHRLIVRAAPGRGLLPALDQADLDGYASYGTEDYDFVHGMEVLSRTVAALLLLLGLLTVTVAMVDRAVTRREELASLRMLGTSPGVLRRAQWLEAVIPVLVGTVGAVLVGWVAGTAYLSLAETSRVSVPWALLGGSVLASVLVAGATVVGTGAQLRPEHLRRR